VWGTQKCRREVVRRGKARAATPEDIKEDEDEQGFLVPDSPPPFLLELASPRAVLPSLLAHLLCADHLLRVRLTTIYSTTTRTSLRSSCLKYDSIRPIALVSLSVLTDPVRQKVHL
jgi:hypothetical protein